MYAMTIAEAREKCKSLAARLAGGKAGLPRDVLMLGVLVLASAFSFGLGLLTGLDAQGAGGIIIENAPAAAAPVGSAGVVASKNGTKYHFPECAGANRITEANKIWFVSAAAAEAAGYALAANCAGR